MSNASASALRRLDWRAVAAEVLQWTRHTMMMVGFFVAAAATYLVLHQQAVARIETSAVRWVVERQAAVAALQAIGLDAAPAVDASAEPGLDRRQKAVAAWLSRRYNIAPLAMDQLVSSAWQIGRQEQLDPTLLLAVMAVESSFNPYARGAVGATGLMQVKPTAGADVVAAGAAAAAAVDPTANVRLGAAALKDAIARGGSLQAGLRMYVGSDASDDAYADRVLAERARLQAIAAGRSLISTGSAGRNAG